ncbi:hypothetical protein Q8A67_007063 [Cirrhinus molitorella]|uniref:RING-type domain-containing protein n=1 Tax=Cirrhinus molitorella TaxID=172907 RepID=A0AA88PXV2_9TELE|nr:hypothetical protein Q8A67_007063 [Cirrhinus molitorella]
MLQRPLCFPLLISNRLTHSADGDIITLWKIKNHKTVAVEEESRERKPQLMKMQTDVQQMIQDRMKRFQGIKHLEELRKEASEKEKAEITELFTELIRSIERCQSELLEMIEQKQKAAEKQVEGLIKELEQEITELKRRDTKLEQFSHTEDHLHLLQIYPSLIITPYTSTWTEISISDTQMDVTTLRKALIPLQETLDAKLTKTVLKRMQQHAVDVTLDPDTAHTKLILSDDRNQIRRPQENSRKIYAIPEQDFVEFQNGRRAKISRKVEDGSSLQEVIAKIDLLKQAAEGLQDITSTINQLSELAKTKTTAVTSNACLSLIKDAFSCLVCKALLSEPMFAICCESLVGCRTCVEQWLLTADNCLKCRAEQFNSNVHQVKGLTDFLSFFNET